MQVSVVPLNEIEVLTNGERNSVYVVLNFNSAVFPYPASRKCESSVTTLSC